ncbi:MAG: efflux RND transporter permease subunit, partial [Myxococcales bacterium]|nr:efflux RND transporter permease subunit [Myxococcales bacterium]
IREREIHVLLDRQRLSSFGLSPSIVLNALKSQNLDFPSGKIENDASFQAIRVKGKLKSADEIALLPIPNAKNINLRIRDVAQVKDTIADEKDAAFIDKESSILFSLQKQSGANTTEVAEEVKQALSTINSSLPDGVSLKVITDNSLFIKGSIDAVKFDLFLGALLAIFIVLIFLKDWRITLISATALPTAVIASFAFLEFMGFSLNMMTTLALSLSIGILIDDAIIVVENIHRHLMMGKKPHIAARDASQEIGMAVVATTLSLCAVFVPVAFMRGIIGRFFFQFGLTVAFAVLTSLFVAFSLTPMLSSRFLKNEHETKSFNLADFIAQKIHFDFSKLEKYYEKLLSWCLDHNAITLFSGLAIFIVSIFMLKFVPVSFFPSEDTSEFMVDYELAEGSNIAFTKQKSLILAEAIKSYPGVETVITKVGTSLDQKPNKASLLIKLVDKKDRTFSQKQMMDRLRTDLVSNFQNSSEEISFSDAGGSKKSHPIQFIFRSDDWTKLEEFSDQVAEYTKNNVSGVVDVQTTKAKPQSEYKIVVDTLKAADLGVTPREIATTMHTLFEGEKAGNIQIGGKEIDIKLRIADENRVSLQDIAGISIANTKGGYVSLASLANILPSLSPSTIERLDGQRQITLNANFSGKNLNAAVNSIQKYIDDTIPSEISTSLSGQAESMKDSIQAMIEALILAVILVFIVLCVQYESYMSPMVIMAALPLSLSGAFGALLLTGQIMSVYTMIGIILLMGLVTKNGILLIEIVLQKIHEGVATKKALLEAGPLRLRPILMTTFAAGGGMLPVAIGHGVGGEARSPMGVAVIGGLLASTLLTLVIVPCLFSVVEKLKLRFFSRKNS